MSDSSVSSAATQTCEMGVGAIMTGIQFVTAEKGRKVAVQIDLKTHGAIREDFWDGLVSESRSMDKGIPY